MFSLLLVLVAATASPAEPLDVVATAFAERGPAIGFVLGLATPDSTWVRGYGRVGLEEEARPDGDTVFDVARLTGCITGMLVFDAIQTGAMSLDHPLERYMLASVTVPSGRQRHVSLGDLVLATSGLPDLPPTLRGITSPALWSAYRVEDLYRDLATTELEAEPGARVQSSLFADAILGVCLQRASTVPLAELLSKRITSPLGLASTGFELPASVLEHAAEGHDAQGEPRGRVQPLALRPAMGLLASANDLTRLLQALLQADRAPWMAMDHYWWTVLGRPLKLKARDWADFPADFVASDVYVGLSSASALVWEPRRRRVLLVLCNTATADVEGLARDAFDAWRTSTR